MLTAPTEDPLSNHVGHARQQIVYGREKGYVFGAFCPRHGRGLQCPLHALHFRHQASFLEQVDTWLPADQTRIDTSLDNLSIHSPTKCCCYR